MQRDETARAVLAAMERDPAINLHRFPIDVTSDGETLRLQGEVENIIAKRRSLQLAREVAGHARIDDQLKLKVAQPQEDQELTQTVIQALSSDVVFANFLIRPDMTECSERTDWIGVSAENGRVTLHGAANSLSHRRMAEVLSWWVRGCADVDNRIHVQPDERDNDAEINDAIRLVLDKDPSIDAQQVAITTRDHEVYLTGALPSEEARRIAAYDCWYIPGVHNVHNEISVRRGNP